MMAKLAAALLACSTMAWASPELPSPADVEKLVCQLASQKQIEEKATSEICMLINKTFPMIKFSPDCKTMLESVWDLAVAQCPKQLKAFPNPADLEKLACELASQKQIEEKATSEICKLINTTFPTIQFNPDCKTLLEGAWDLAVSYCPKNRQALPSPADVEKLVCELASQKQIEEKATAGICMLINKTFPTIQFNPDCKTLVEGAWDLVVAQCPKGYESLPKPADLKKLVCKLASKKQIEQKAAGAICATIHTEVPAIPVWACSRVLKKEWDQVVSHCPEPVANMPVVLV